MNFRGFFSAIVAACFFGLIPTLTKLSYYSGANPALAILFRYTLAVLLIGILIAFVKFNFSEIKKHLFLLFLISIGSICLTLGLLVSVLFIPVSMVALIFYTYPLIVLIYSIFSIKKINHIQIVGFIMAFVGLTLALGPEFINLNIIGIFLAFLAAIGAGTVLITNEHLSKYFDAVTINAFTNFVCFVVFCFIIFIKFEIRLPSSNIGWSFVFFASFCYCIAFFSQLFAVKNIGSARTALLLYLEPIVAIVSAIILLNESLSNIQVIGISIVIVSLLIAAKRKI